MFYVEILILNILNVSDCGQWEISHYILYILNAARKRQILDAFCVKRIRGKDIRGKGIRRNGYSGKIFFGHLDSSF